MRSHTYKSLSRVLRCFKFLANKIFFTALSHSKCIHNHIQVFKKFKSFIPPPLLMGK